LTLKNIFGTLFVQFMSEQLAYLEVQQFTSWRNEGRRTTARIVLILCLHGLFWLSTEFCIPSAVSFGPFAFQEPDSTLSYAEFRFKLLSVHKFW